jgi:outer membrane protein insertion porin family/translocation and assembly module TamA
VGQRTTVATLWLSGCDEGSERVISDGDCAGIREALHLRVGGPFTESAYNSDRELLRAIIENRGRAAVRVRSRAMVDPATHHAHVTYVLDPGPESFFGTTDIREGDGSTPIRNGLLPSGYPVGPVRTALAIEEGTPYTRSVTAAAQRRVFDLGAFGIVRVTPIPVRCHLGAPGCTVPMRDPDSGQVLQDWIRVDLQVQLSPKAGFFQRFGVGAETDQLRSSVRASWRFESRNFLGGMRRLTGEVRPTLYLPSILGNFAGSFAPGLAASLEFRQPEVFSRGSVVAGLLGDVGPDPFNPNRTSRAYIRGSLGVAFTPTRNLALSFSGRGAGVTYFNQEKFFHTDPIYAAEYQDQFYAYLDAQAVYDLRDNPLATREGYLLRFGMQGSHPVPFVNQYGFFRGMLEGRVFIPASRSVTLAVRVTAGAVVGWENGSNGWPVPQELRFYSGGANSNRGYPFNRVGPLATVPRQTCVITNPDATTTRTESCNRPDVGGPLQVVTAQSDQGGRTEAIPDTNRLLAIGGLGSWEASAELRWYLGSLGLIAFFDASDVFGWTAPLPADVPRRAGEIDATAIPGAIPAPELGVHLDAHPTGGVGLRYISPIGVIRFDFGLRLDDLGCSRYRGEIAAINTAAAASSATPYPQYYAVTRPPCSLLGLQIPGEIAIAIGEAY